MKRGALERKLWLAHEATADNKVIRCMNPGQPRPRETWIASCPSKPPRLLRSLRDLSPGGLQFIREDPQSFEGTANLLAVKMFGKMHQHGAASLGIERRLR
jgi:hypothetical protein